MRAGLCMLLAGLLLVACNGSDGGAEPADVELVAGDVTWREGALEVEITATVLDADGLAVPEVLLRMRSDRSADAFSPAVAPTDAQGRVVFAARTTEAGYPKYQAVLEDSGEPLGDPLEVDLGLTLGLETGEVRLTSAGFEVDMHGRVEAGIAGIPLRLESDRGSELDSVDPAVATTGADGRADFTLRSHTGGAPMLDLTMDGIANSNVASTLVILQANVSWTLGDLEWTVPGAQLEVSVLIRDPAGVAAGLTVRLSSDRQADAIAPESAETGADGTASFQVSSQEDGLATLSLEIDAVELDPAPSTGVTFCGPRLSGGWTFPQPGGLVSAVRVGAIWIDLSAGVPNPDAEGREIASVAVEPLPELGGEGSFELVLPMDVPEGDLYAPDPQSPDFRIATYGVLAYDDLDASEDFSQGDAVLSVPPGQELLTYALGAPDTPPPGLVQGYQFMHISGDADPEIFPLEDLADQQHLDIRMAPCPATTLRGQVHFGEALEAGSDTRVAVVVINTGMLLSGNNNIFEPDEYFELAAADVAFEAGAVVDYELAMPDPHEACLTRCPDGKTMDDFLYDGIPEVPPFGVFVPLVYLDKDGDDELHPGMGQNDDQVVGMARLDFGCGSQMIEWLDDGLPFIMAVMFPGLNQGYNHIREPLKAGIVSKLDDHSLEIDEALEPGHSGLPFRIERGEEVVLAGDDLDTGDGSQPMQVSSAAGFAGYSPEADDELVITVLIEQFEALDFDSPYDLVTP